MDRGSTSAFQTEVVKSANKPIHLVEVHFDDESLYMTDGYKTISYASNSYTGIGHLMGFTDIEETAEVIVSNVTLQISGIDQSWISRLLNKEYIDRVVKIYKAFIDDSEDLIVDPVLIFEGRMDSPTINENPDGGESILSINATNTWVDFTRMTGRHTNHEENIIHFEGDKGFEFSSEIVKDIKWGKS